jgi:hypothetical protein
MTNLDMRNVPDHYPERGDQVHLWLQDFLQFHTNDRIVEGAASRTVERLIRQYELAADEMLSLENVVNGVPKPSRHPKAKRKRP